LANPPATPEALVDVARGSRLAFKHVFAGRTAIPQNLWGLRIRRASIDGFGWATRRRGCVGRFPDKRKFTGRLAVLRRERTGPRQQSSVARAIGGRAGGPCAGTLGNMFRGLCHRKDERHGVLPGHGARSLFSRKCQLTPRQSSSAASKRPALSVRQAQLAADYCWGPRAPASPHVRTNSHACHAQPDPNFPYHLEKRPVAPTPTASHIHSAAPPETFFTGWNPASARGRDPHFRWRPAASSILWRSRTLARGGSRHFLRARLSRSAEGPVAAPPGLRTAKGNTLVPTDDPPLDGRSRDDMALNGTSYQTPVFTVSAPCGLLVYERFPGHGLSLFAFLWRTKGENRHCHIDEISGP